MPQPADSRRTGLQLRSLVTKGGQLQLSLQEDTTPVLGPHEVLIRVEASPLNPSDLGLLLAAADMSTAATSGSPHSPVVTAAIPPRYMSAMEARAGMSMPVGNEGAGTVIAAGASDEAQALLGRIVAVMGGGMYAQYRCANAADCLVMPKGATAADGASCFVNPLTALGMVETMRREGHAALVHTAAASNLGQMLNKVCIADGVGLVNIVRSSAQVELLRSIGAAVVCDSSSPTFKGELVEALVQTGATLAFDAIGGGRLAGQILTCMEIAANETAPEYSRYGSSVHKQIYIYGGLDTGPTEFNRAFGMAWGMGGWLRTPFLKKIGPEAAARLHQRVVSELKTTFASHYTKEISLAETLHLDVIAAYNRRATGEKYLINPNKDLAGNWQVNSARTQEPLPRSAD